MVGMIYCTRSITLRCDINAMGKFTDVNKSMNMNSEFESASMNMKLTKLLVFAYNT